MIALLSALLLVNAAYNVVVWPRFYARVSRDARARDEQGRPTRFLVVHAVLIGVALLLAAVSAIVAIIALTTGA
ncbi:MAG: hypothetical protein J0I43_01495 [Microbacterium sp.]|uniref:SCO4848 family membrane protein n=1 Tax=Microbacterium sp. TaxID=51671 RepID=UPI001AC2A640|nr:hypothetical protein [Microbacterium sp.]MBN9176034.1 hypothetical protein [Microbacterium sp.]